MRRHKHGLFLLLALTLGPLRAQALQLDELMARLAQASQRRANFVEEKRLAALDQVLRSTGRLSYSRPAHLEKITTAPQPETLVVDGGRLIITVGQDAPRVVELDDQPEVRAVVDTIRAALSGNLAALQRDYDIAGSGSLDDWHLVLHPRTPVLAGQVREVRIAGGADVRSIESVQANGDTDRLTITPEP